MAMRCRYLYAPRNQCVLKTQIVYLWGCQNCPAWQEHLYCRQHFRELAKANALPKWWCERCHTWSGDFMRKDL